MKLWKKNYETDRLVEKFTVGNDREMDAAIATFDVIGSIAHVKMLNKIGIINGQEKKALVSELEKIKVQTEKEDFFIPEGFEDIHSYVETILTEKLGETGKKIHTGRSRNDQILVDLHLFFKSEIREITRLVKNLFDRLILLSEEHKEKLLPGYTHFQVAMPSSFGLWFAAYAEALIDDVYLLEAAFKTADQNPLGSAAGFGSSFQLDRQMTTELLKFKSLKYNSVAAQMSRGKLEKTLAFAFSSVGGTLSKFAMDVCLYMCGNFAFINFPDHLTTGSSIMPHKKNPDVFELIRAKCNRLQSLPNEITLTTGNLPSGYHRDFQILKEIVFPAIQSLKDCLIVAEYMLQHIVVKEIDSKDEKYKYMFSVDKLNEEVRKGASFRDAYRKVGMEIQSGKFNVPDKLNHTHIGSIGNLCNEKIIEKMKKAINKVKKY